MKLTVLSPEDEDQREQAVLCELFAAGLSDYHLRKPSWDRSRMAAWLRSLPSAQRERVVLHTHHDLAHEFAVGGLHERDVALATEDAHAVRPHDTRILHSRAVHDLAMLGASLNRYDRLFFSPVFPSISKPGYVASIALSTLVPILTLPRRAKVFALGGITVDRCAVCRSLGFDGVAVLGAVWHANDPVNAFRNILAAADDVHAS